MRGGKAIIILLNAIFVFVVLSSVNFVSSAYMYCNDTDGGQSVGVYGQVGVSFMSVPAPGEITWSNDGCFVGSSPSGSCTGDDCFLREYYCNGVPASWEVNYTLVSCASYGYTGGCSAGKCVMASAPSANCYDGIKNGNETDIDCGGAQCSGCDAGQTCSILSDCLSEICTAGYCYENEVENSSIVVELGPHDPEDHTWNDTSPYYNVMMQIEITAVGEDMDLEELRFKTSGTGDDTTIMFVNVYEDLDANGELDYDWDLYMSGSSVSQDNGNVVLNMLSKDVDEGDTLTVIVVYSMMAGIVKNGTYTLEFEEAVATGQTSLGEFTATGNYENTKTVVSNIPQPQPLSHCYNFVMDSDETGIDCGGLDCVPCWEPWVLECIPSETSCPSMTPPLCDNINGLIYGCSAGVLTPLNGFFDYDSFCAVEESCYEGDVICNHEEKISIACVAGEWVFSDLPSDYVSRCRPGTDCDAGFSDIYCYSSDLAYQCNEFGEEIEIIPQGGECDGIICSENEILCDYGEQVLKFCDGYDWYSMEGEEAVRFNYAQGTGPDGVTETGLFEAFCSTTPQATSCNTAEKRCGILDGKMEICDNNRWSLVANSESEFNQLCSGIDCRANWFKCNPFTEEVSFCSGTTWGTPRTTGYENYCRQEGVTSGPGPQVITGEVVNNTVVVYRYLDNDAQSAKKKGVSLNVKKPVYWIGGGVILIILISLIIYFATKYSTIKSMAGVKKGKLK